MEIRNELDTSEYYRCFKKQTVCECSILAGDSERSKTHFAKQSMVDITMLVSVYNTSVAIVYHL